MKLAFLDSSCIVAVLFGERGSTAVRRGLQKLEIAFAANLLEAEVRAAGVRESIEPGDVDAALAGVRWVHPVRQLSSEFSRILIHGHLRGADLWPLACALYLADSLGPMPFLTLDSRQAEAARALGLESELA